MYTADKITDLNQDKDSILKPRLPPVTAKPSKPKTTSAPAVTGLSSFCNILQYYMVYKNTLVKTVIHWFNIIDIVHIFGVLVPRFETWENSSVFSSVPASKVDAMGKERYIGNEIFLITVAVHVKHSE